MKRKHLCLLLLVFLSFMRLNAQEGIVVLGIVLDEAKEPMPGVTVAEKGTSNGTMTDLDGRYSIKLTSEDAVLVFRFLGYETQEVRVGGKKDINLQLNPVATELTEVVVVGYGAQKKASVVGAISAIKPEAIARTSKTAITQSLAGNVAGVIAVQRSGEVGNDHADFWIRGINTFAGGSNPLIIVDGVERSFNSIDPQEIESFSVLKDASATAIYGVRGANGVIIITTKKGKVSPPQISFNIEKSFKAPTMLPKFVDAVDYMKIANEASLRTGHGEVFTPSRINNTIDNVDPDLYPDVNWIDELVKPMAHYQRVNLNITGGAPKVRYFVSASYHNESGLFKTDTDRNWNSNITQNQVNFRSNLDINITSTTTVGVYLGSQMRIKNSPNISSDYAWNVMMEVPPYFIPKRYSDGRLAAFGAGSEKGLNPYNLLTQYGTQKYTTSDINATANIVQKLDFVTKGLEGKLVYAYDVWTEHMYTQTYSPELWYATSRDANNNLVAVQVEPGSPFLNKSVYSNMSYRTYLEGSLIYNRTFNDHQVGGLFLYSHSTKGVKEGSNEYGVIPYKYQGIAARATYGYKGRYLAEFNMGYNGSENFAKGKRFGFFPAFALGWIVSEEDFWQPLAKTVNKLKIRGSFGEVGNDQFSNGRRFAYITEIRDDGGYDFGLPGSSNSFSGLMEGHFGFNNLTWETETKRDIGLEIGLFNMLELNIDYFFNSRRDILVSRRTIPGTAGFNEQPFVNYGKMQNKGVDLSLSFDKQFADFRVSARGTFTYARNKMVEIDEPEVQFDNLYETGHRFGQQYGLVAERLYEASDFDANGNLLQQYAVPTFFSDLKPGDIKYVDINGDGYINDNDKTAIGYTEMPEIVYGFGVNVAYKNFDFGVRFQGVANTTRMINDDSFLPFARTIQKGNLYEDVIFDRWTESNPRQDVFFPRMRDYKDSHNYVNSTWWQKDMSFLRMKDIELGYSLPQSLIQKRGIQKLRFYVLANNILTFSKFKLWDVELGTNNGMKYPMMKNINIGLELTF